MATKVVSIGDVNYTIAPIDWDQYEESFFDADGNELKRPKIGNIVKTSLANATAQGATNPNFIPAGDIFALWPEVLEVSRLKKADEGEAPAAPNQ